MTFGIILIWAVTIPAWPLFITDVLNAHDPEMVKTLLTLLVVTYIAFLLIGNHIDILF